MPICAYRYICGLKHFAVYRTITIRCINEQSNGIIYRVKKKKNDIAVFCVSPYTH